MNQLTFKPYDPSRAVLVLGGGIAGMQAALELTSLNHTVYLLERTFTIGGNMARLDKTFPTNDCSTCMIAPRMVACSRHRDIEILTGAELLDLAGEPGRFTAHIRQYPRYVDQTVCISCGQCVEKCPKQVPNEYNGGFDLRKAIHFIYPQAIPLVPVIDTGNCIYFEKGRCRACEKVCPTNAIQFQEAPIDVKVGVGAVVLATGFELGLVPQAGEYGFRRYANVVTNLDYERMLSAAGPYGGQPERPSDGAKPQNIAWIQCVASRDCARHRNFCSSVCCMAAVKQAMITREHNPSSTATIFYMDIRAHGKDFDRYVARAKDTYGVRFIHSMLSQVIQSPTKQNLILEYFDRYILQHRREEFDLVVLSAGFKPSPSITPLLCKLGVVQNAYGFVQPDWEDPTSTTRQGIFVCGVLDGPKDIPESVSSASAAAASVGAFLVDHRIKEKVEEPVSPVPRDTSDETPRIGVFVCHCGKNIAGVLPVEELRDFARTLPHVVLAENCLFTCSTQTQERIRNLIIQHQLNRIVVAACSPRTHEPLFQETMQHAGLNKHLFEMANIRDQCSWVHGDDPSAAVRKAKGLIQGAVARASLLEAFDDTFTPVIPTALVVGGGVAGMTAALNLADQGISVVLVEKEDRLGGMARRIHHTMEGSSPRRMAERLAARVKSHRNIFLYRKAILKNLSGRVGQFRATIEYGISPEGGDEMAVQSQTISRSFGAIILATGGQPYRPDATDYSFGEHPDIITQLELEKRLVANGEPPPETTVMIQCVGSRREDFPMCSRICCSSAVKNAIRILRSNPSSSVFILYRDIRTFGFKEQYYKEARDLGALFIPFLLEHPPEVLSEGGGIRVRIFDPGSQMHLQITPNLVVLSTGVRPPEGISELGKMLKLPFNQEGFFLEAHPKLSPLDFSQAGVFVCGLAHSPRFIEESLTQAKGAACRAAGLLLQKNIRTSGVVAEVNRKLCAACLVCVNICPYKVPYINGEGISVIDAAACQGCGICVSECPAKAISFRHYSDEQLLAQITAFCEQT